MYAYLDRPLRSLAEPDLFLLSAMRSFVAAAHRKICVCKAIEDQFAGRAISEAIPHFVAAMALINRDGNEPIRFAPIVWPKVTDGEARILSLFALGRSGDTSRLRDLALGFVGEEAADPLLVAIDTVSASMAGDAA